MPDSKNDPITPKYRSIDDILDALKNHSQANPEAESKGTDKDNTNDEADFDLDTAEPSLSEADDKPAETDQETDPLDDESPMVTEEDQLTTEDPVDPIEDETTEVTEELVTEQPVDEVSDQVEATNPDSVDRQEAFPEYREPVYNLNADAADDNQPALANTGPTAADDNLSQPVTSDDRLAAATPAAQNLTDLANDAVTQSSPLPNTWANTPEYEEMPIRRSPIGQANQAPLPTGQLSDTAYRNRNYNNRPFDYTVDREGNSRPKNNKFGVIFLIIFGIIVVGGAAYLLKYQFSDPGPVEPGTEGSPAPTITADATPTATPAPTLTRADYKVRVLNGTSTSGLAGDTSDALKELGYQIDRTGNATNSAFTQTQVRVKTEDGALAEQLIQDLVADFKAIRGDDLRANDAANAEVIIGAE